MTESIYKHCAECGGDHEPSGARIDCIRYWKLRALQAENRILVDRIFIDSCRECDGKAIVDPEAKYCQTCLGTGRESIALIDWAVVLLSNATPSKVLDEIHSRQWCEQFGKWFAVAQERLNTFRVNHP